MQHISITSDTNFLEPFVIEIIEKKKEKNNKENKNKNTRIENFLTACYDWLL